MPRNRPGALRARRLPAAHARGVPPPARIPGLSLRTSLAVHRLEDEDDGPLLLPGATASALHRYRAFATTPGRGVLYPRTSACPACPGCGLDDVRHARDILNATLHLLTPPGARTELARALNELDRAYRLRTLPDPRPNPGPWWHRRLSEGAEGW
ncbi:hypothetical protein ABT330_13460 [Streptomyces sp. NPDC000658]|uniref:hypothetical protein n=1 Tax=Streptomyces sp. NPDC000658 TaxID=3154266 RepID=UPI003332EA85